MGEDDDEQTGNCYRLPPMNSAHTAGKEFDDRQDKPKYKRQEFMRPKYGAVSFDVIDAVNARLAAASVGEKSSNNDFFNRIRYDTSIENDKINESNNPDVVVDFNIRPTMIQSPSNLDNPNNRGAMTAPGTPLTNRAHRNPLQSQPINDQRTSKSNRSITNLARFKLSVNKKFPTGGSSRQKMGSYNTSGEGIHAFADGSGYNKAAGATTTASRWHDSFDETGDDDPILPIDANAAIPRSPMNNRFPRTILSPQQPTTQAESSAIASSSPSSNNINNNNNNATTVKNEGYISPRLMRRSISASKSAAPLASADSGLGGSPVTNGSHNSASSTIMSHFKNLVNSFNIGSGSGHSRRRSLSRGISLDDHRSITNAQKPSTTSSTHATPNIYRRSEEPKDRQTLEDEERELRRQRRLRRRSDCQQMLPEKQQLQQQQNQDRYHYKYDHGVGLKKSY
uniref:Uncharacterized protein n=1 Tax=Panagrolaimus davidi TaxID=227884 RepID=A0A914PGQ1_9BILA